MGRLSCLIAAVAAALPVLAGAAEMRADTSASTFTVHVRKSGIFSAFGHEHAFSPAAWRADATFDPAHPEALRVDLVVDAASLHDHERGLSQKDRTQVDRQAAGPQVLDAGRFPEIRFDGAGREIHGSGDGTLDGVLHGTLTLHGAARPLDVPFRVRSAPGGYVGSGTVKFRQSAFGIKPYATAGGAIGVRDEVQVDFALVFRDAAAGTAGAGAAHAGRGETAGAGPRR